MAKQRIAHIDGTSTTGTAHGVLIEATESGRVVSVTITGADGKKRHASTVLAGAAIDDLIAALSDARKGMNA